MTETQRMPRLVLVFAFALLAGPGLAAPLSRDAVPEPLRPWVDWVLRGHEAETCPFLHAQGERHCVWPGRLALALDAKGGRFEQELFVAGESDVALPGAAESWPEDVRVGSAAAAVFEREGRPSVRLGRGVHRIAGRFVWRALPPLLAIPPETGIVALRVGGEPVAFPRRDAAGRLWLRDADAAPAPREAEDRLELDVHRRIIDAVPLVLETHVTLRVSGAARDELLGRALPANFVPTALEGPLPARLEPDGRLRVQLRPGQWVFTLLARHEGPAAELALPAQPEGAAWDASEVWSFEAQPALRLVEVEGAPAVDPTQTELPEAWRSLPAYRLEPGATLRLVEQRRGMEGAGGDALRLVRRWHLDFDGGGATVVDRLEGELRTRLRLEMNPATTLGRAALNGMDQPVTQRAGSALAGVELPLGPLALDADSRVEGGASTLPAVGWDADVDALEATLELPPGWRLLHVSGADRANTTWISRWTLLDLFVVLVVAMATLRLFGARAGGLALATLALVYTEPGAPRWVFVFALAAEALRSVVPEGRLARAVRAFRLASLATLVLIAIPFAVAQLRAGLFPALARPWQAVTAPATAASDEMALEAVAEADLAVQQPASLAPSGGALQSPKQMVARERLRSLGYANLYAPDPEARVQTGPGRPDWGWETIALSWSGPVERSQELSLWLLPPWLAGAVAVLRVALLAVFVLLLLGRLPKRPPQHWDLPAVGRATMLAGLCALAPSAARADFPAPQLLDELRQRLLEPPACAPQCASASRLALAVAPERLELRLAVDAAAESAVPLPSGGVGDAPGFTPDVISVDGRPAEAVRRDASGQLWLRLAPGAHTIVLAGALPNVASLEIPLPLRPQRVELVGAPRGWTVLGLDEAGRVPGALQLARDAAPAPTPGGVESGENQLEPSAIPPFVSVERTLELGLRWQVTTQVVRVAPPDGAIVLEVPLLAGESVTTPGVRVQGGRALVTLAPGEPAAAWTSVLKPADVIALEAPRAVAWSEAWRLDAGPLWHVTAEGIPAVDALAAGTRQREWRPWPGEKLTLTVEKPEGADGTTLTIDRSQRTLAPGLRASDATLVMSLRSSQGGQHFVTLPEGAELTELLLDGATQPLRQEGARVAIPLAPGAHEATLRWREPNGVRAWYRAAPVDLGAPSVNAHAELHVPSDRWVLFVGGPHLGPSVLFWPILLVVAALAVALGRIPWTPLRTHHWLGLGLGLTQAPLPAAGLVVAWLLALGWRGRLTEAERTRSVLAFDLLQIVLAGFTVAALAALFLAIQMGLLGSPVMQIAGNGSEPFVLRWYQDRAAAVLPQPWLLSLSLWFYRGVMLLWALWVAQALVGWLRWGWKMWTAGGYWLRRAPRHTPTDPPLPQSR